MFCSGVELSSPTSIAATPTPRGRKLLQGSPVIQTGRSPLRNADPGRGADTLACSFSERAGCHAGACQVGNVVVRAMALAGLRHGAVPYFRLVHPKVVPFQIQYGSERFVLTGWHRFAAVRFHGLGCGEFFRSRSGSVRTGMCHHFLVCNDVLQHLHPLRRPKTAKIESRPQARHWRSHKTVAEVDRSSAIVENHS